jgi:hypothetical protein
MSYFDATLSSARLVGRIVEDFYIDTVRGILLLTPNVRDNIVIIGH